MERLRLLYHDADCVAVYKPAGLVVHRNRHLPEHAAALQQVRGMVHRRIYPVHRLDRATSGLLLFALHPEAASLLAQQFQARQVSKTYLAVVRGHAPEAGVIDHELLNRNTGEGMQPACTHYRCVARIELPQPVGIYPTARYSLLEATPETGRWHQIRRHLARINHPVVGDVAHGDRYHNRFFRDGLGVQRLLLHASALRFTHPFSGAAMALACPPVGDFAAVLERFAWALPEAA